MLEEENNVSSIWTALSDEMVKAVQTQDSTVLRTGFLPSEWKLRSGFDNLSKRFGLLHS